MMENDEEIDFHKLEKEFSRAVEADAKYQRENSAKFRAVEQRVGSYEEFKDIVAASHLKPLEKKDRIGQERLKQPWNTLASKKTNSDNVDTSSLAEKTKAANNKQPQTSLSFTKIWKYKLKTTEDKYSYLCTTGGQCLGQILKAEIPMGLFGDIIAVLRDGFQPRDFTKVIDILSSLATTNRFNLTVEFLNSLEKKCLQDLFVKLHETSDNLCEGTVELKDLLVIYKVTV